METILLPFSPRFIVLTICAVVTALLIGIGIFDHNPKIWEIVIIPVVIFGALTVGASAQVRGPVMGYLPDNGALRTLYGIPAAGWVSDPIAPDRALSLIEMSPDQSRALAIAADTGALMLLSVEAVLEEVFSKKESLPI